MKRVLIITYYWPPSGGAGVQRWLKFSKYLPDFGWQPVVYTPENPESPVDDPSLQKDIHPDTEIIRKPIWEPYQFYRKFLGMSSGDRINAGFLSEKEKPGKKENISVWIRGNLFIPDARKFWIRPSVKYLTNYLEKYPVDAIISTGPPHSMHLIAMKICERSNIPWLADFRDPWTGIDFYSQLQLTKHSDKQHHLLEKQVLRKANKVVVVGRSMANEFKEKAAVEPLVITNGFDKEDFITAEKSNPEIFTILHVGAINKDRNHDSFWKALSSIKKTDDGHHFKLKLIGKLDIAVLKALKKYDLEKNTEIIPHISHELIASELTSASLLYLPINDTPNAKSVQTGKIFEYIAAGKPILGIGPEDGDAAAVLKSTGVGVMIDFNKTKKIKTTILQYLTSGNSLPNETLNKRDQFERKYLTQKLVLLLNEITSK